MAAIAAASSSVATEDFIALEEENLVNPGREVLDHKNLREVTRTSF